MLKKRNLIDFYTSVAAVEQIFRTIVETNAALEKELLRDKNIRSLPEKNKKFCDMQNFILSHIESSELKQFAEYLMQSMIDNDFKGTSSVPTNTIIISDNGLVTSDYEIVSRITLYHHTLNCAICAIDVCKEQPLVIRDIVLTLCLLHDFGKNSKIQRHFKNKNESHDQTSARFAKEAMAKFDINEELQLTIFNTLFNHHNQERKESTIFLPLLIKSDIEARILEKKFIKMQKGIQ